ncbi:hypothetical protein F5884DRAFT_867975 [Xylogone sp. PMI_703]|nr:hypothetical protein F5884DRAFT_867975 [Xylogone sp. PMI_703]
MTLIRSSTTFTKHTLVNLQPRAEVQMKSSGYSPLGADGDDTAHIQPRLPKKGFLTRQFKLIAFILAALGLGFIIFVKKRSSVVFGLQSDILFGDIPYTEIVINNNDVFLNTDPFVNGSEAVLNSPWDEMYVGSWVAIDNPSKGGASNKGMRMVEVAAEPQLWPEESEAME